jgi:uncharacterized protein (DUF342 family)
LVQIHISSDRLKAFLDCEEPVELAVIEEELTAQSVVFGIDVEALKAAISQDEPEGPTCIANGVAPIARTASRVELANEQKLASGHLDTESGRMDFRERGCVHSVQSGDLVGTWYPGTDGIPGTGVDGLTIDPPAPNTEDQSRGVHVRSEVGEKGSVLLYADIDGVVRLGPSGDIYVTNVFEVEEDVDLSCGNIEVDGSVHILGTIRSGFRVHAGEDITVECTIENASVKAGQSLSVGAGILSGVENLIQANDLIRAKFTQNANLRSGGDIIVEVDTNSTIEAGKSILAKEGPGHLRGGVYMAGQSLIANELGSSQGVETIVRVGINPQLARELVRIRADLLASRIEEEQLQRTREVQNAKRLGTTLTPEHAVGVRQAMKTQRDIQNSITLLDKRQVAIQLAMVEGGIPFVRVDKVVHAGVRMQIGDAFLTIEHTRPGGTFRRDAETGKITQS